MQTDKRKIGDWGEKIAERYLKKQGYRILERQFLRKWGELDLVARRGQKIIFAEVKTIKKNAGVLGGQNLHFFKQQKLIRTSQLYLLEKKYPPETDWQIDAIIVELDCQNRLVNLEHLLNAIY